jgi:hypothetical protein
MTVLEEHVMTDIAVEGYSEDDQPLARMGRRWLRA